jgi:hypothetical protein
MKKIFSILLVVAMVASLSLVSFAATQGMKTTITETDSDITVTVTVGNVDGCNSVTALMLSDKVTLVDGSVEAGAKFAGATYTAPTTKYPFKFVYTFTDAADYITDAGEFVVLTYKVAKVDASYELSAADFAYGTGTLDISKITTKGGNNTVAGIAAGNNFTSKKQPAYFTIEYVDERTKEPDPEPEEEFEITKTEAAIAGTDTMKDENGADVAAAGDKVVAIFAKNVSDTELVAGSYGIVFGGVRYAGQLAVPAKTAWAIKLVGSAEQLPAGSYAYGVFAGDATVDAATPWVID